MKKIIFSFLLILTFEYSKGQSTTCASNLDLPLIQQNNSAMYQRIMALEQHTQNYINSVNSGNNSARLTTPNATIIIPVVVHVLHRNEAIGVGRNISVAQIQSQIDVLNEDFRRLNADRVNTPVAFQPVAADPNFEFRLACIDPNGNPTNGITRTFAGVNQFNPLGNINPSDGSINEQATGIKFTANGGRDAWPTDRYLNIWVCDMSNGLIGYGQFPFEYSVKPNTDGVVMLFNAFGRVGNLQFGLDRGKVCIHEIGHWLNLRHIWGDANCGNDFVDDTPTQQTANRGCPAFPHTTCNNGTNGDMFMNYMDYTNNACQNIYTRGQSLRMRAVFAQGGPRASFINNYFRIIQPTDYTVCTSLNLSASNPSCLPITWSVVSGPLTISGGQNTNTVTLSQNGNGTAVVRAEAGGYVDDITLAVGIPQIEMVNFSNAVGGFGYWCSSHYNNLFSVEPSSLNYNAPFEARLLNYPSMTVFRTNLSANTGTDPFGYVPSGWYILQLRTSNACGTSPWFETEVEYVNCLSNEGGGENFRVIASPNPTDGELNVTTDKEKAEVKSLSKTEKVLYQLYDFNRTNIVKQWSFDNSQNRRTLNVRGLKTGQYILVVSKGKYRQSTQIIIK